jgi:serpin B
MTLPRWFATLLVSAICLAGVDTSITHAGTDDQDVATIAAENNDFAVDLYGQLAGTPGNLFFSPYSIDSALAMTLTGAGGQTAAQMRTVLHSSLSPRRMNAAFSTLSGDLDSAGTVGNQQVYDVAVANSLWGQSGFNFKAGFLQTLQQYYGATLNTVDFASNPDQAGDAINQWVAQETNNKIQDLFPSGSLSPNTQLVLVNAIYFLGNWQTPFNTADTTDKPFHVGGGQPDVSVSTMKQVQPAMNYFENDQMQVVELPYLEGELSMFVLLPRDLDGLPALEEKLTGTRLNRWLRGLEQRQVTVFLPKFKLSSEFDLSSTLSDLGMVDAFTNGADFSGIAPGIHIEKALHKAYVSVDEAGTEAAAATGFATADAVPYIPIPPAVFRANHPFIFLIRDNVSGAILFMGRVTDPSN